MAICFRLPTNSEDWEQYRLTDDQVEFYHENGYVSGIKILNEKQIDWLRNELAGLVHPDHDGSELWYEYHTNESADPETILFHALGAWRIRQGFHDLLWHPAFTVPASQLLNGHGPNVARPTLL